MQLVSCHGGTLRTLSVRTGVHDTHAARFGGASRAAHQAFSSGLAALDALLPGGAWAGGAMHELLFDRAHPPPRTFALLLAKAALASWVGKGRCVVWSDPGREIYPPALVRGGLPLERVFLLHPTDAADEVWAATECLRSRGVAATIVRPQRLSRVQARRLQLAAERGGGVGLLLRPARSAAHYAAATRWRVAPAPGEANVQRWRIELIHGHGGQVGKAVILEVCRETDHVSAFEAMADRSPAAVVARASA